MKQIEITVSGRRYPSRPTMGAMLRFRQHTGREVTEIDPQSLSDLCTYLWCCTSSACRREGIDFDMPLMDFADALTPDEMAEWSKLVTAETDGDAEDATDADGQKKSPQASTN